MIYKSSKLKLAVIILGLTLYVYFLIFIKTVYMKSKKLEQILDMALETEREMVKLHTIDNDLAKQMERLEEMIKRN